MTTNCLNIEWIMITIKKQYLRRGQRVLMPKQYGNDYKSKVVTQAATVFIDGVTLHLREAIKFSG